MSKTQNNWIFDPITNRISELIERDFGSFKCNGSLIDKSQRYKILQQEYSLYQRDPVLERLDDMIRRYMEKEHIPFIK